MRTPSRPYCSWPATGPRRSPPARAALRRPAGPQMRAASRLALGRLELPIAQRLRPRRSPPAPPVFPRRLPSTRSPQPRPQAERCSVAFHPPSSRWRSPGVQGTSSERPWERPPSPRRPRTRRRDLERPGAARCLSGPGLHDRCERQAPWRSMLESKYGDEGSSGLIFAQRRVPGLIDPHARGAPHTFETWNWTWSEARSEESLPAPRPAAAAPIG